MPPAVAVEDALEVQDDDRRRWPARHIPDKGRWVEVSGVAHGEPQVDSLPALADEVHESHREQTALGDDQIDPGRVADFRVGREQPHVVVDQAHAIGAEQAHAKLATALNQLRLQLRARASASANLALSDHRQPDTGGRAVLDGRDH